MEHFSELFRFQFKHMVSRKRFRLLFLFVVAVITLSFLENCFRYYGMDIGIIPSAAMGWIGRTPRGAGDVWNLYIFAGFLNYLLLPVGALVFADFYLTDQKEGTYSIIIARSSADTYHLSGALLCFLGAFGIVLIPLLLFYPVCFVLFPHEAMINPFSNVRPLLDLSHVKENAVLYPDLFYTHPHLSNLIYIFYNSLLAGAWALFSYTLSRFLQFSRILIYVLPTAALLFLGNLTNLLDWRNSISIDLYMNPTWYSGPRYLIIFWAYLLIPLFFSAFVIMVRLRKKKVDEL